jgi:hypothetical protein
MNHVAKELLILRDALLREAEGASRHVRRRLLDHANGIDMAVDHVNYMWPMDEDVPL